MREYFKIKSDNFELDFMNINGLLVKKQLIFGKIGTKSCFSHGFAGSFKEYFNRTFQHILAVNVPSNVTFLGQCLSIL